MNEFLETFSDSQWETMMNLPQNRFPVLHILTNHAHNLRKSYRGQRAESNPYYENLGQATRGLYLRIKKENYSVMQLQKQYQWIRIQVTFILAIYECK